MPNNLQTKMQWMSNFKPIDSPGVNCEPMHFLSLDCALVDSRSGRGTVDRLRGYADGEQRRVVMLTYYTPGRLARGQTHVS